ncbi:Altered inheritance of mitochondria protein 1 [Tolypocladium ophioglossoides CBS 100239]|uniref:Altered inheritance of mitochondria protein 1 n=1 Tax=Tolypocladium ophioglossoides (strain CBS 100239) TaxID=1163406 RepID=A0A0L0MXS2_TOLOC|nr:Altered inheritance of mitochondria protein 1 [Tolypocladium ophioglossoides CBS 100239]
MICPSCRAALRAPILRSAMRLTTARQPRLQPPASPSRLFSSSRPLRSELPAEEESSMTPAERSIAALLSSELRPTHVLVQDVSGGCGSMYAIQIASPLFRGQTLLKQQRMVNAALGDVVKSWHGVQIRTVVPPEDGP